MAVRVLLRVAGLPRGRRGFHPGLPLGRLVQFNLTDIGEGIKEVTVKNWFVREEDEVKQFDDICEVESDKATVSITSRYEGKVTKLHYQVGDVAFVGRPLVDIDVDDGGGDELLPEPVAPPPTAEPVVEATDTWNKSLATPAVRRIAMENNVKVNEVKGTGKHGRVMKEDILAYLESTNVPKVASEKSSRAPLTSVQKAMTKTMTEALKIPQFGFTDEINVSKLVEFRSEARGFTEKKGVKLTFLPFFIKAISKGLLEYPVLNSTFDVEKEEIVYKEFHNIGVAVDSPSGLLVPNVKNVQGLSIIEIAKELDRLRELASKMKLPPSDLAGGTFTVSNIGNLGGTGSAPVILPPQVAILGVCQIQRVPRFDSAGNVTPADILSVSWAADHRIIDGATVARCTQVIKYYLQNPATLLLDL